MDLKITIFIVFVFIGTYSCFFIEDVLIEYIKNLRLKRFKQKDDWEKPIPNEPFMEDFCIESEKRKPFYHCWACPYHKECEQYYFRHGRLPYQKR